MGLHGFLAGGLQGQQTQHTITGGHLDPRFTRAQQGARRYGTGFRQDAGFPDLDGLLGDGKIADRPGIECPN